MSDEEMIKLVGDGIGSHRSTSANMELQRRLNVSLCSSIKTLDSNIQKQSRIETNLTRAMYFLAGVGILFAVIQILVSFL